VNVAQELLENQYERGSWQEQTNTSSAFVPDISNYAVLLLA
jgi:hypothetical protein